MYDYAAALVRAGRPAEAIPVLEARLQRFDNQSGTVWPAQEGPQARAAKARGRAANGEALRPARFSRASVTHGLGRVRALVALAAAGAGERLVHVLDREHAERARARRCAAGRP